MGGRIITLGSDVHESKRIADQEVKEILKEIGFNEIYTFEKMQPIAHVLGTHFSLFFDEAYS